MICALCDAFHLIYNLPSQNTYLFVTFTYLAKVENTEALMRTLTALHFQDPPTTETYSPQKPHAQCFETYIYGTLVYSCTDLSPKRFNMAQNALETCSTGKKYVLVGKRFLFG